MMKSGINHSWIKFAVAFNIAMLMSMVVDAQLLTVTHSEDVPIACFGGTATISVSVTGGTQSGLEYSINGIDWQSSNIFAGLAAEPQTVYARDDGANTGNESFVISEPPLLTYTLPDPLYFCDPNDGQITVNPAGGTPNYTIEVVGSVTGSKGIQTIAGGSAVYPSLGEETFTITVTDANICSATPQDVVLFHDVTAPICVSYPADILIPLATFNGFPSNTVPVPSSEYQSWSVVPSNPDTVIYLIEARNYENLKYNFEVTQSLASGTWSSSDYLEIHISYVDGGPGTPIYIDRCVWDGNYDDAGEGENENGNTTPTGFNGGPRDLPTAASGQATAYLYVIYSTTDGAKTYTFDESDLTVTGTNLSSKVSPVTYSGEPQECSDNSGAVPTVQYVDGDINWLCNDAGNREFWFNRTWEVTDPCGNENTAAADRVQRIAVGSTPSITDPADLTFDICHNDAVIDLPEFSDNCTASISWEVTVNGTGATPPSGTPGALDEDITVTFNQPVAGNITYTITWTVTDDAGFSDFVTQDVTILAPINIAINTDDSYNFCTGESGTFTINLSGGSGAYDTDNISIDPPIDGSWSWVGNQGTFSTTGLVLGSKEEITISVNDVDNGAIVGGCPSGNFVFEHETHFTLHELITTPDISRD